MFARHWMAEPAEIDRLIRPACHDLSAESERKCGSTRGRVRHDLQMEVARPGHRGGTRMTQVFCKGAEWRAFWLFCLAGCASEGGADDEAAGGSIFGGSVTEGSVAGGGGSDAAGAGSGGTASSLDGGEGVATVRCSGVAVGSELRIDDFEDGNSIPRPAPDRQSFWTIAHDETDGVLVPDGSPNPVVGGADGTDYALHVTAEGYSDWGVNVDAHLRTPSGGLSCPYDASNTRGIGLYLKGAGQLRVGASTAGTVATEFGGRCDPETQVCWDVHLKLVPLAEEWTYEEISWESLSQAGWGTFAAFDAGELLSLRFGALPGDLPLDVWVDEIVLLPLEPASDDTAPGE